MVDSYAGIDLLKFCQALEQERRAAKSTARKPGEWSPNQATNANGLQARQMEFGLRIRF